MPYVDCPVFIIHGSDDKIVPFEHGQILHDLAPNKFPPYWVEGRGHNDLCEGDFGWSKFYEHKVLTFEKIQIIIRVEYWRFFFFRYAVVRAHCRVYCACKEYKPAGAV